MAARKIVITSNNGEEVVQQRHLPQDLIIDQILPRLPIKSLVRFKSVSKYWYSSISSHQFANTHLKLSPFLHPSSPTHCVFILSGQDCYLFYYDDDESSSSSSRRRGRKRITRKRKGLVKLSVKFNEVGIKFHIVGSCNGLVCLAAGIFSEYLIVWNPITKQWRKITEPWNLGFQCPSKPSTPTPGCQPSLGFGYASSVEDHKVVHINYETLTKEIVVHVFSLKSNQWRRIHDGTACLKHTDDYHIRFITNEGVLVGETLYWPIWRTCHILQGSSPYIIAFDLVSEKFYEFCRLDLSSTDYYGQKFLCAFGGYLYKYRRNVSNDIYIDMLKHPGICEESICLSGDRTLYSGEDFVGFTRTGKLFIMYDHCVLGLVDPTSEPVEYTELVCFEENISIANHVPSLISPLSIAELQEE